MLEAILLAAGRRAVAAGNVGRPLVEVVTARADDGTPAYDAIAVELSSFQLHWSSSIAPAAAVVLNVADDHTDWHGSFAAYRDAKARILALAPVAVADAGDPVAAALVAGHPHPVTVTLGEPARASSASGRACWSTGRSATTRPARCSLERADAAASRARTTRSTPSPPPRWPGPSGWRPTRWPRGLAGFRGGRAPQRAGRHRRRGGLRRRQQGHQPARGRRLPGRLPARGLDRGRAAQGRRRRPAGRRGRPPAGRGGAAGPRPGGDRRLPGATRPIGPSGHGGQRRR